MNHKLQNIHMKGETMAKIKAERGDQQQIKTIERQLRRQFKAAEKQIDRMEKWKTISRKEFLRAATACVEREKEIDRLQKKLWPFIEREGKRKGGKFARDFFSELEKVLGRGAVQPSAVVQPDK